MHVVINYIIVKVRERMNVFVCLVCSKFETTFNFWKVVFFMGSRCFYG